MNSKKDLYRMLRSASAHERLSAARALGQMSSESDLAVLQKALKQEKVSYVRKGLERSIRRLGDQVTPTTQEPLDEPEIPEPVRRRIYSQAVKWITGLLLHEISSGIGLVADAAEKEIHDFKMSKTNKQIERVISKFSAIEMLRGAANTPKLTTFDLSGLIREIVDHVEPTDGPRYISLDGPAQMPIVSDKSLVSMAIDIGMRNAFEAVSETDAIPEHSIIISWGETDIDYWVVILDSGPGLGQSYVGAFNIGSSTKEGHLGYGLAIAKQASETLGGQLTLQPAPRGGARYEIRWEKAYEDNPGRG